jgi:hypothetical protein
LPGEGASGAAGAASGLAGGMVDLTGIGAIGVEPIWLDE